MTRDPLDDLGGRGLTELFGALTSEPSADELFGEYAALTMFRSARTAREAAPLPVVARRRHRMSRPRPGGRLVAAATVVALGGFAVAAYVQLLPSPVQHLAHQLLGFAGVRDSAGNPGSARPGASVAGNRGRSVGSGSSQGGPHSARSNSPSAHGSSSASPGAGGSVTLDSAHRIVAGSSVQITAYFTRRGQTLIGVSLTLTEQAAGRSGWHPAGQATTGPNGEARFTVPNLRTNASFRATGPGRARSEDFNIVVRPTITVGRAHGRHGRSERLIVSIPLAQRGDVVQLYGKVGGHWKLVQKHHLHAGGLAELSVVARKIGVTYRVVLLATVEHGQSVSRTFTVAARPKKRGPGRQ